MFIVNRPVFAVIYNVAILNVVFTGVFSLRTSKSVYVRIIRASRCFNARFNDIHNFVVLLFNIGQATIMRKC
jgi:hypothetical protein